MSLKQAMQFLVRIYTVARNIGASPSQHAATSMDLSLNTCLSQLLGFKPNFYMALTNKNYKIIMGWGRKKSGKLAVALAKRNQANCLLLEDGFLRSVDRMDATLSLVFDNQGIYYDAKHPSQIETHISRTLLPAEETRTKGVIDQWCLLHLSKYNNSPEFSKQLPSRYVLVIDQVAGDLSVGLGNADASSFTNMLKSALAENPDHTIIVKVHPDVFTRARSGYFDIAALQSMKRVKIIAEQCHPVHLVKQAYAVYVVTSQIGFEALIWGKKVRCFGMPFYAGWGLTNDNLPSPRTRKPISLEQLVHGALIRYPRYVDPELKSECDVETVMEHIGLQRQLMFQYPENIYALGFSLWKKPILRRFLFGSKINFVRLSSNIPADATIVVWGNRELPPKTSHRTILRIEDGFLRSSGLGAELHQPLSWVIDDLGIYYDMRHPSRLEIILQNGGFDTALIERAKKLRVQILSAGVSKYNISGSSWHRPTDEQRVILVPGQVEQDASIRFGTLDVKTNIDLLRNVRAANPDAYIVYKPHPDVVAGLRKSGKGEEDVSTLCDEIITDVDPVLMFSQIDELHTMTSLIGFEALLRDVSVTCYGQPFYSGWGLTNDISPPLRRNRKLLIEELVAGALIVYTRYVSRETNRFTSPERAIGELVKWRDHKPPHTPLWRRSLRNILRLWARSGLRSNA